MVTLKDIKEINPVDLTKYAVANKIYHEPAFSWWVLFTLLKINRIVPKMQKKYWRTTHKFKIEVPTSVKSMYEIDNKTGTDFWRKLVAKEIINEKVA